MTMMRRTEPNPTIALLHSLKLAGVACAITVLTSITMAHAGEADDEEAQPDQSFEQKIIGNIMHGLGGQTMEDNTNGIDYRERSPLVVPSKLDLPPPAPKTTPKVANWPKDPDVQARRAAIEESKQPGVNWDDAKRPLMPSELATKPSKKKSASTAIEDNRPGMDNSNYYRLSPSELGFNSSMWSGLFGGKQKAETKTFVSEPSRATLTQPPAGYQTPSSGYAYGMGPIQSKTVDPYNPITDKGGDPDK